MTMQTYVVQSEGWLEDGFGIGAYRTIGEEVRLLPVQAQYIIATGQIAEKPIPAAPAAPASPRARREPASE